MDRFKRLKKNDDFQKVFKGGRSTANRQFVIYALRQNHEHYYRLGLSVSKKIGNAVVRNRVKRYIKEVFRDLDTRIPSGYDFIVIARKPSASMDYHQVHSSLCHVLRRAKLLNNRRV